MAMKARVCRPVRNFGFSVLEIGEGHQNVGESSQQLICIPVQFPSRQVSMLLPYRVNGADTQGQWIT